MGKFFWGRSILVRQANRNIAISLKHRVLAPHSGGCLQFDTVNVLRNSKQDESELSREATDTAFEKLSESPHKFDSEK